MVASHLEANAGNTAPNPAASPSLGLAQVGDWGPESCWKRVKGREGARAKTYCPAGHVNEGGRCWPTCRQGYTGVGPTCWQDCPSGMTVVGPFCAKPWWVSYPSDMVGVGFACTKNSYGRGLGQNTRCNPGDDEEFFLCYDECEAGYTGSDLLCW